MFEVIAGDASFGVVPELMNEKLFGHLADFDQCLSIFIACITNLTEELQGGEGLLGAINKFVAIRRVPYEFPFG